MLMACARSCHVQHGLSNAQIVLCDEVGLWGRSKTGLLLTGAEYREKQKRAVENREDTALCAIVRNVP